MHVSRPWRELQVHSYCQGSIQKTMCSRFLKRLVREGAGVPCDPGGGCMDLRNEDNDREQEAKNIISNRDCKGGGKNAQARVKGSTNDPEAEETK